MSLKKTTALAEKALSDPAEPSGVTLPAPPPGTRRTGAANVRKPPKLGKRPGVLFIAHSFPPRPTVAARRFRQLARWAGERFERVYAIRADRDRGEELTEVENLPVNFWDLRSLLGGSGPGQTIDAAVHDNPLAAWFFHLRQSAPFLYLFDDGGPIYRRRAFATAERLITEGNISTIISSYRPWSDHLVAKRLKERFPHLYWIADFRDLPVDPVRRDVVWPGFQHWWCRRTVGGADELWAVSEGQAVWLGKLHGKVRVHRSRLAALPPARTAPVSDRFTITYTGSLYPRLQTISPLIEGLNELGTSGRLDPDRVEIIYHGKDTELWHNWTAGLDARFHRTTGHYIAPAAAQELQRSAQVLLLLNWSGPNYYGVLTAKLFDYLGAGRPILGLVNGPGDRELDELITGGAAGAVFPVAETQAVREWIAAAYTRWATEGELAWTSDLGYLRSLL